VRIRELFTARDMTQGAPWRRIMEFALPMLIGNFAQQLYNTVDSVIVGAYWGDDALAAVGSAMPILNLMLALFVGVSTGAGVVVAQSYGAKDREGLSVNIGNCLTMSAIASVVIMIVGPLITYPLLQLLGTDKDILNWCAEYLIIYFVGIAGFFFYNMLCGILRGLGDSFSALMFLLISAALNVALDLLLVQSMKVAGVALATVIAQAISAVFCYLKLRRMRDVFDMTRKNLRLVPKVALRILRIGIPSGITQGVMAAAGMMVLNLTNAMGKMVVACNVIVMRVDGFAMMPNMTFGQAMSVYAGQNVGARAYDRVRTGTKQGLLLGLSFAVTITAILLLFGRQLFGIFTQTEALIQLANQMIQILAAGYICICVTQVLGGVMRGAGDTVTPMWISIICNVLLRVPVAYLLAALTKTAEYPDGQPIAIFGSLITTWVLGMVISIVVFAAGKWKKKMYASGEAHT